MGDGDVKEIEHPFPKANKETNFNNSIGLRFNVQHSRLKLNI